MRWKVLAVLIALTAATYVFTVYYFDSVVKDQIESTGSSMVGAKVSLDSLTISFRKQSIRMTNLEVADPKDPWKNLFEIKSADFDFSLIDLLMGRVKIENLAADSPKWGTKRETFGGIEKKPEPEKGEKSLVGKGIDKALEKGKEAGKKKAEEKIKGEGLELDWKQYLPSEDMLTNLKNFDVKSIVNPEKMESLRKIKEIRDYANGRDKFWKERIGKLKKDVESLKSLRNAIPKKLDPMKFEEYKKTAKGAENKIKGMRKELDDIKKEFQKDMDQVNKGLKLIDELKKTDLNKLKELLGIPDLTAENFSEKILGPLYKDRLMSLYEAFNRYKAKLREYQEQMKKEEEEKDKRLKGVTVHYPVRNPQPRFYLKKASLMVDADKRTGNWFSGKLTGLSSDQKLTGSPTVADFTAGIESLPGADFAINGVADLRKETAIYNVDITAKKLSTAMITNAIGGDSPVTLSGGTINSEMKFGVVGDRIKSRFGVNLKGITVQTRDEKLGKVDPVIKRILAKTMSNIKFIEVAGKGEGTIKDLKVSVSSNLDEIFKNMFKEAIGEAIKEIEKRIAEELDRLIAKQVPELKGILMDENGKLKNVDSILSDIQSKVEDEVKGRLDKEIGKYKKQLQGEIDKKKKQVKEELKKKEEEARKKVKEAEDKLKKEAEKKKKELQEKLKNQLKKKLKLPF